MASYEYILPVEQWRQVLLNVPTEDLCNVVLTSRRMDSVASLPELWDGMKVSRRKVRENGLAEFYNINRFKKVKQISLNTFETFKPEELERLLKEIPESPLEDANLSYQDFSRVSPHLLASAISHLHIVNMGQSQLETDQCVALLKTTLQSSTRLINVCLENVDLRQVPAELLANSISQLRDANLSGTNLTTDQCVALLKASLSSATLTNTNLAFVNLSEVPAKLLAKSVCQLQNVNLWGTVLTTVQCVALLKASFSSTTLTNVVLGCINLSDVPAELLANSVSQYKEVNLYKTDLTTDQCVALLKARIFSTALTNVSLDWVNLSEVPAELLANSIGLLKDVNLWRTCLTTDQCVALLRASLFSTTLTNVNLQCVNLSEVPAELLANSICRLQDVNLCGTDFTTDQCVTLLKVSLSSTTLKNVNLKCVNLSDVPAELLANSVNRLQGVNLWNTHLTTDQCVALLKARIFSTTLTNANLRSVNLSEVPAELLANSISRLQKVIMCGTHLTADQCVALLHTSLSSKTLHHIDLSSNENIQKPPDDKLYLLTALQAHISVLV